MIVSVATIGCMDMIFTHFIARSATDERRGVSIRSNADDMSEVDFTFDSTMERRGRVDLSDESLSFGDDIWTRNVNFVQEDDVCGCYLAKRGKPSEMTKGVLSLKFQNLPQAFSDL